MCLAIPVWLLLLYVVGGKPGWFACVLVLLAISVLLAGCG
jgi:hypothetical protein